MADPAVAADGAGFIGLRLDDGSTSSRPSTDGRGHPFAAGRPVVPPGDAVETEDGYGGRCAVVVVVVVVALVVADDDVLAFVAALPMNFRSRKWRETLAFAASLSTSSHHPFFPSFRNRPPDR
jgi:hypothetical protein